MVPRPLSADTHKPESQLCEVCERREKGRWRVTGRCLRGGGNGRV